MRSFCTALNRTRLPSHATPPVMPLYGPATRSNVQAMSWASLPARDAGNVGARAHDVADARHVYRTPVVVAEAEIGRMAGHLHARQHRAVRVVHPDAAGTRAIHVAFNIAFEPIGIAAVQIRILVKQATLADAAIRLHIVNADQALAAAIHVKQLLIGR